MLRAPMSASVKADIGWVSSSRHIVIAPAESQSAYDPRREQVLQADAPEHFRTDPVRDAVDDLAAVLRRVDMGPEWALAKGQVDDLDDRLGDSAHIGVGGFERSETLQGLLGHAGIGAFIIFRCPRLVGGRAGGGGGGCGPGGSAPGERSGLGSPAREVPRLTSPRRIP